MKFRLMILVLTLLVFSGVQAQSSKTVYTCPMHPKVQMDKPGKCPICGMTLVKKTVQVKQSPPKPQRKPSTKPTEKPKSPSPADTMKPAMPSKAEKADSTVTTIDTIQVMVDSVQKAMPADEMKVDTVSMETMAMDDMGEMDMSMGMPHAYSLHLPMSRNGSGTGWLPDASPMYGYMFHRSHWMYMLHGNFFLRYNSQDITKKGSRGASKIDAPDWLMFMGQRPIGSGGLFHFSIMSSLDAVFGGGNGYPLLFQSGEAYKGQPIVDRQHPHDLFSELSVSYAQSVSQKADVFVYLGYPGEPALGPVAFMHRPSALDNPDAPITHHWVDATHVTFGVATFGVRLGKFKLEGSSFTGREPDEHRFDFDKARFDSWSGRLSMNPNTNWALQVSHGFIKSPELLHPDEDVNRTTASAVYSNTTDASTFNATALWGMNKVKDHDGENAVLLELSWRKNRFGAYGRYEWVQKGLEELALDENVFGHDAVFRINAFTAGLNYDILHLGQTRIAAGGQFTFYHADARLDPLYGRNPMAAEIFLRLYPGRM